jgi:hypothetical protein
MHCNKAEGGKKTSSSAAVALQLFFVRHLQRQDPRKPFLGAQKGEKNCVLVAKQ